MSTGVNDAELMWLELYAHGGKLHHDWPTHVTPTGHMGEHMITIVLSLSIFISLSLSLSIYLSIYRSLSVSLPLSFVLHTASPHPHRSFYVFVCLELSPYTYL